MMIPPIGWTKGPDAALIAKTSAILSDKTASGKMLASPKNQKI
jgi:hypothetical protein